jgi:hypothetical protein
MGIGNRVAEEPSRSRRALLGAGVGAVAATVATALGSLGFATDPATDRFTIRMSSSRTKPTPVAWLLVG